MTTIDTTIVNVALESLSHDLGAPLSTIQWVSTGYLLALASVIPVSGWTAERFGTKTVWIWVIACFVATSGLCGIAWSAHSLIVFRILQGFAGGMIMPLAMIALAQSAGPGRMGSTMSVMGVPLVLGPVLGPVVGGLIVTQLDWRWIFYVNVPFGLVGLVLAARMLTPDPRPEHRQRANWRGLIMLTPGVALLVFGLSSVAAHSGASPATVAPMLAGLLLLIGFAVHASRIESPVLDVGLLRQRGFAAATTTVFLGAATLYAALLLLPLYYQIERGESALVAGLMMAPQGIGAAFGMLPAGRLTDRAGGGTSAVVGVMLLALGTVAFTRVGGTTSYWLLSVSMLVRGVGVAFTMMPAMAAAHMTMTRVQMPRATPMLNVFQRIGGTIGTAIVAVVLQRQLTDALPPAGPPGSAELGSLPSLAPGARAQLAERVGDAFAATYWWVMAGTLLAVLPAAMLALTERRARRQSGAAPPPSRADFEVQL